MDQVTVVKNQFRLEQWKQRIAECQSSGMTIRTWCKQNQVSEPTYYKYLKRIRQELCDTIPVKETKAPVSFQKLEVQSPVQNTQAAVIIHLPSASLEVQNGASKETVEAVLLALQSLC